MKNITRTWIEREWKEVEDKYENYRKMDEYTGEQKALMFMHYYNPAKNWFMAYEFVGLKQFNRTSIFLSHRGPARISDLSIKYPDLIEKRKIHGMTAYRICYENLGKFRDGDFVVSDEVYDTISKVLMN